MTADVIPLRTVWIELTSPGMYRDGRRFYAVDIVEADGVSCMWCGPDLEEAWRAARECADDGEGRMVPVRDLTGALQ